MTKKLMAIDGNSIAYRSFYALPLESFVNSKGQATNAIYGFLTTLCKLITDFKPNYIVIAFDKSRKSFRTEKYKDYKGTRDKTPEELISQFSLLKDVLNCLGLKWIDKENYEADDILASLTTFGDKNNLENLVVSGDRDTFQLVSDSTKILYPNSFKNTISVLTDKEILEKYQIHSYQYQDLAALVGETSDNIIGVPGVGKGFASKWLQQFQDLDGIFNNLDKITGKRGEALKQNQKQVYFNKEINTLVRNLELGIKLEEIEQNGSFNSKVIEFLNELEFGKTLRERLRTTFNKDSTNETIEIKELEKVELPKDVKIVYDIKEIEKKEKISDQNIYDVKLAAYIYDSSIADYSLENLGSKILGMRIEDYVNNANQPTLFDSPNDNDSQTIQYLENVKIKLYEKLKPIVNDSLLEMDTKVSRILGRMETQGITIDKEKLDLLETEFIEKVNNLEKISKEIVKEKVNLSSPKQLQSILFDKLGLPKTKKIKTGYSTDHSSLIELYENTKNEFVQNLLEHREINKLLQIVQTLKSHIENDGKDFKIHTTFDNTRTTTGRLSSNNPNLQNIPIKNETGGIIRSIFIPSRGNKLISFDYSQIEMRILAHMSEDTALIEAFQSGEDLHSFIASKIYQKEIKEVQKIERSRAKAVSFGLIYGQTVWGLATSLKIENSEAEKLMNLYFSRFPKVKPFLDSLILDAKQTGKTTTILGRNRFIPNLNSNYNNLKQSAERMAMNAPIQGSAADLIKKATIDVDKYYEENNKGSKILLQIHDELIVESSSNKIEETVKNTINIMENAMKLKVPLKVSYGVGDNLFEAEH